VYVPADTAYAGIRTEEGTYRLGAKLLAEGLGIRATARILDLDKDTVGDWVKHLGRHCARLMDYHFRPLHLSECQLDELGTFVRKKEERLGPVERMLGLYGDAWVWIALAPVHKLVSAWLVGKRTLAAAKNLVKRLKTRTDGHIPFFTSDELPHDAQALLDQYGVLSTPPKRPGRGRPASPRKVPPEELLYAVVVKRREKERVVEVSLQVVYGTPERGGGSHRCLAGVHHGLDLWGGAQQSDPATALATLGTQGECLLEGEGLPAGSVGVGVGLLSFCRSTSGVASTTGATDSDQGGQRVT
jgi:hypothetical protein